MIVLRRFLAVLLIILFLPLFLATLLALRVNDTLLSADFYTQELRNADVFTFLYDELVPAGLEDLSTDADDLPVDPEVIQAELVASLREVLPPEWLQEQAESAITEVVPYLTGEVDEFTVAILVSGRLEILGEVIKRKLGEGDTYTLVLDQVIAPALEDELTKVGDLPFGVTIPTSDIVAAVEEVLPPEWVRARIEHGLDQLVPYLTGKADHFAIQMPVADRLRALTPVLKDLLVRSNVYNVLSNVEFAQTIDQQLGDFGQLPFGTNVTSAEVVPLLQTVAPPEWIQPQIEQVLDAMTLYVTGDQEGFIVVIPLKDRIEAAAPAVKELLRQIDAYALLFDEVIATLVEENLGQGAPLFPGISITTEEIVPALREVLPPEFIQAQAEAMIDELVPYTTGEYQGFRIVVPLANQKDKALAVLEDLASRKLADSLGALPACTIEETLALAQEGITGLLPSCRPPGFTLEEVKVALGLEALDLTEEEIREQVGFDLALITEGVSLANIKESLGLDLTGQVGQLIGDALPDEYVYTDADLRATLGEEHEELLDKGLDWGRNGFTYTDSDLREDLVGPDDGTSQLKNLNLVLGWGRQGLTYTDTDLREDLAGPGGDTSAVETLDQVLTWTREGFTFTQTDFREALAEVPQALPIFDTARQALGQFRPFAFLGYLLLALLLVVIGFLGGRKWRSRLAWAAVVLGIAAGITDAAAGPVYQEVAKPLLGDLIAEASQGSTAVEQVLRDKATAVTTTIVDDFLGGLATRSLVLLIGSFVAIGAAILVPRQARASGLEEPSDDTEPVEPREP